MRALFLTATCLMALSLGACSKASLQEERKINEMGVRSMVGENVTTIAKLFGKGSFYEKISSTRTLATGDIAYTWLESETNSVDDTIPLKGKDVGDIVVDAVFESHKHGYIETYCKLEVIARPDGTIIAAALDENLKPYARYDDDLCQDFKRVWRDYQLRTYY